LNDAAHQFGVLIAAHGGRDVDRRSNESIVCLAENVAALIGDVQVMAGFVSGVPTIGDAITGLAAQNVIVYPLFMADGYFGRTVLNRLVEEAKRGRQGGSITVLPPLGLDPALADLAVTKAESAATSLGMSPKQVTLVLLAHGSARSRASAIAAERVAINARAHGLFADVRVSFLDEAPSLKMAVAEIEGAIAVAGLFSGDGLHGGNDAKRLMMQLDRNDVIYVGNIGLYSGLEKLIAAAVTNAIGARGVFVQDFSFQEG
jgi:sirohydrochlorin ferrochelatase